MSFLSPKLKLKSAFSLPIPLNSYLIRLIVGALGPLLVFSIFMMVLFARQEQANRRRGLEGTARSVALAVDQEIRSSISNLEALATAEPLDIGAVNVFKQAVAERFLKTKDEWRSLTLYNPLGQPLAIVQHVPDVKVSPISRESLREVMQTGLPVVNDFPGVDSGASSIGIYVPVVRDRTIIYILSAAIEPRVFTKILAQQQFPEGWAGTLYDSKQIIVARSRDAKKFIGTPVGPLLGKTNLSAGDQFLRGVGSEGASAYAAVSRLQVTDWFFSLTVPSSELNAILYRSLAMVGGGGLLLLLSGLGVALLFARRASQSITELSGAAHDLGRGQSVTFPGYLADRRARWLGA